MSLYSTCPCGIPEGLDQIHFRTGCPHYGADALGMIDRLASLPAQPEPAKPADSGEVGRLTQAGREAAMRIACKVVLDYGEGDQSEQVRARNGNLWRDHPAFLAALEGMAFARTEAADTLARLEAENFRLAAGQCIVENGLIGDDHGHFGCSLQARVESLEAERRGLVEALHPAVELLDQYAAFVLTVPAADLELHPYQPAIEQAASDLRAALAKHTGGEG